ncbi:MAG: hypothetical protein QXX41_11575, partial [Nitrososphaerota archaeon]
MSTRLFSITFIATFLLTQFTPSVALNFYTFYPNSLYQIPLTKSIFHSKPYSSPSQSNSSEAIATVLITYDVATSRNEIIAKIKSKIDEAQLIFVSNFIPVLSLKLPAGRIPQLEGINGVKYVFASHEVKLYYDRLNPISFHDLRKGTPEYPHLYLNESSVIIGANKLWGLGVDGRGVYLAVIDSGVNWTHPDLVGKVVFSA